MIQTQALSYRYANGQTLGFADLQVAAAAPCLITGASGSGKSTLLALFCGLLTPSEGRLLVGGQNLAHLTPRQRDAWRGAQVGLLPQRLHLSASLSVQDNLQLPYVAVGLRPDAARITRLLSSTGLSGLEKRRPHELSLGQAQRVALVRALLRRPALILADEPTANLDDHATAQILNLMTQTVREQGATLVIATHDSRVRQHLQTLGGVQALQLGAAA